MAEERQDPVQNGDVPVLDGDQPQEKEPQGEIQESDKDKQKLDSALGRITGMQSKIDSQETIISSLDEKLDKILDTMSTPRDPEPQRMSDPDFTQDPDFMPTTKTELDAYHDQRDAVRFQADQKYSNAYTNQIGTLAKGEGKEVHEAIIKEMMEHFNVRHSGNGTMDADLNYSKASRSYFKKQLEIKGKTGANPLTGPDKDNPPLGGGLDGEEMPKKETPMPKLDADAQAFIKDTGMKEESVKKALTGEGLILRRKTG